MTKVRKAGAVYGCFRRGEPIWINPTGSTCSGLVGAREVAESWGASRGSEMATLLARFARGGLVESSLIKVDLGWIGIDRQEGERRLSRWAHLSEKGGHFGDPG